MFNLLIMLFSFSVAVPFVIYSNVMMLSAVVIFNLLDAALFLR